MQGEIAKKNRLNVISNWLTTFERIEIKISVFRRFVDAQMTSPVHSSKFKFYFIFVEQHFSVFQICHDLQNSLL